jgi:hypothetical protein
MKGGRKWASSEGGLSHGQTALRLGIIIFGQGAIRPLRVTPVMEAGISNRVWSIEEIVGLFGAKLWTTSC